MLKQGDRPTSTARTAPWLRVVGAILLAGLLGTAPAPEANTRVVEPVDPLWIHDGYRDGASIQSQGTSALVNTAGTGTVQLPYAPLQAAFQPGGTYALVATEGGIDAYAFDGEGVLPLPHWNLAAQAATGAAWLAGGNAFAISSTSQVVVYGIAPDGTAVMGAETAAAGVIGLAPGPGAAAVLVATARGVQVYRAEGRALVPSGTQVTGVAQNLGVAATADGSVMATWQRHGVEIWTWDGAAYQPAPAWNPPMPGGMMVGLAFFPQGGGYWLLSRQGQLAAYAYGSDGLTLLAAWSLSVPVTPWAPVALATGWSTAAAVVVYPDGWVYRAPVAGGGLGTRARRGLQGQAWAVYVPRATLLSVAVPAGHAVHELRVEDANCAAGDVPPGCAGLPELPMGTTVQYQVSTDGCQTWTPAPVYRNVVVPRGSQVCYQLTLRTTDPLRTPVVDVTNVYEIAAQRSSGQVAALLCSGQGC